MVIWKGWGILALIVPVVIMLASQWLSGMLGVSDLSHPGVVALVCFVSAIVVWFVGKKLNGAPEKILLDAESGEEVRIKPQHSLFWIPMQWFSLVWVAYGIAGLWRWLGHP